MRWWSGIDWSTKGECGRRVDRGDQIAKVAWGREVLVFFGDLNNLHTTGRSDSRNDRFNEFFRCRCASSYAHNSVKIIGKFLGPVHSIDTGTSGLTSETFKCSSIG
jgi:hypothetical protein